MPATKPNLLLINPNTTPAITQSVLNIGQAEVGAGATLTAVTADFGARYIASRAAVTVAAHAVLDAYATALATGPAPDGIIVACFGDPGLDSLQDVAGVPVMGFAHQGLQAAAREDGRFAIATIGDAWRDMLLDLAERQGLAARLGGIITLDESARDPAIGGPAIQSAAAAMGVARVVIGGTGLIPVLDQMASHVTLPVIDPHRLTFHAMLAAIAAPGATTAPPAPLSPVPVIGLSAALTQLFTGTPTSSTQDAS